MKEDDDEDLKTALAECYVYNKIGALDRSMIEDIAYDNGLEYEELLRAFGWE